MEVSFYDFVKLLNQEVSIYEALDLAGIDYVPGKKDQFISCPFHDEEDPSAKIYSKTNNIKCFGRCHKSFGVYNVLKKVFSVPEIIARGEIFLNVKVVAGSGIVPVDSKPKYTISSKFNIPVEIEQFLAFSESKLLLRPEEGLPNAE